MDATVNDLVSTIGEQTVELKLLRRAYQDLQVAYNEQNQELTKLTEAKNDKEPDKKDK